MLGEVSFRRWLRSTGRDQTQALQDAQRYFERALAEDPRSVDARVGIAKILVNNLLFGLSTSTKGDGAHAEQLLLEAIETQSEPIGGVSLLRVAAAPAESSDRVAGRVRESARDRSLQCLGTAADGLDIVVSRRTRSRPG